MLYFTCNIACRVWKQKGCSNNVNYDNIDYFNYFFHYIIHSKFT